MSADKDKKTANGIINGKNLHPELAKNAAKTVEAGHKKEYVNPKEQARTFFDKHKGMRAALICLGAHSVLSIPKKRKTHKLARELEAEYNKISQNADKFSIGDSFHKAMIEMKKEKIDAKLARINKREQRLRTLGGTIAFGASGFNQIQRTMLQKETYNSVRADRSGSKRQDVIMMATDNMVEDEASLI